MTGTNQFGYQLFSKLPGGSNVLISPLSISIALRMALNGASGETYDQISKALGASGINLATLNGSADAAQKLLISDPAVEFSIANSIW
ncbi:serpin family protein, partial [Acinetobacter baumannii]